MDAVGRPESPRPETKDVFILVAQETAWASISMYVFLAFVPSLTRAMFQVQIDVTYAVGLLHKWESQGQGPALFSSKQQTLRQVTNS